MSRDPLCLVCWKPIKAGQIVIRVQGQTVQRIHGTCAIRPPSNHLDERTIFQKGENA